MTKNKAGPLYSIWGRIPLVVLFVLLCPTAVSATVSSLSSEGVFDPYRTWTVTQRLRDAGFGQPWYNFSDSLSLLGRYAATCSMSANRDLGRCLVWYDPGSGMQVIATITDPTAVIGDQYGYKCLLFQRLGAVHLAVGAIGKLSDGAVFVYRQTSYSMTAQWPLQQMLTPANNDGTYATSFGRHLAFDGYNIIVSAVSRYQFSDRYSFVAINIRGTSLFYQSTGTGPIPGDPLFVYATAAGRGNTTTLSLYQTIRGANYTYDFGASLSVSPDGNTMAVGASFRNQALFGSGTDGDLVVADLKLLDGSSVYNFNSITILPGGTLTVNPFNPITGVGGIMQIQVTGTIMIHTGGVINMTGLGFNGAPAMSTGTPFSNGNGPGGGGSATSVYTGINECQYNDGSLANVAISSSGLLRNTTSTIPYAQPCGGGGGYGTPGQAGTTVQCGVSGLGGNTYGSPYVIDLQRGSGGGAGQPWSVGSGGAGGAGGGAIHITAQTIINNGVITADGAAGEAGSFYSGGGGGGSGGSIFLQGITLTNNGYIRAIGGVGGIRSATSGSQGTSAVIGGSGGYGRISLSFLTTTSHGIVNPSPINNTGFVGDVYLYTKNVTNQSWAFLTTVPRIATMRYTGFSVAVSNTMLAMGSDNQAAVDPEQSVFLIALSVIHNSSSSFLGLYRQFWPPQPSQDLQFGYGLTLFNNSLIVSAYGSPIASGKLFIFSGRNLLQRTDLLNTLLSQANYNGNYYALHYAWDYPTILVQVPFGQDDGFTSPQLSNGCVQVVSDVSNISSVTSSVTCPYATATANTSFTCVLNALNSFGGPAGHLNDLASMTYPPNITFVAPGTFTFTVTFSRVGSWPIYVMFLGSRISGPTITVTNPILPYLCNVSCAPLNPNGGDSITCTIKTYNSAGEESATPYFRAVIYNIDDLMLTTVPQSLVTPYGLYRTPPPPSIVAPVNLTDFPAVLAPVNFQRFGYYTFTFTAWRSGQLAAFVQYQGRPVSFPNPTIITVGEPTISAASSSIVCPAVAAPNRTMICTLTLLSATGVPTMESSLALNYSSAQRYVQATLSQSPTGPSTVLPVTSLWANEGRISLLVFPTQLGTVLFTAQYKGQPIPMFPPTGVNITTNYAMTCEKVSSILMSFTLMNQQAMGLADPLQWGAAATLATYVEGPGMCDDPYV